MEMKHYRRFGMMLALSFVAMYAAMYATVDRLDNAYLSLGRAYMAALMTAPMALIELAIMGSMYPDKRMNRILMAVAVAAVVLFWMLIRTQAGIGDRQFLRGMISHHAGAVLVCRNAKLDDGENQRLCQSIIESQESEIRQMTAKLREMGEGAGK